MIRDPNLPHQIVLLFTEHATKVVVSCNCRKGREPLAKVDPRLGVAPMLDIYKRHLPGSRT